MRSHAHSGFAGNVSHWAPKGPLPDEYANCTISTLIRNKNNKHLGDVQWGSEKGELGVGEGRKGNRESDVVLFK